MRFVNESESTLKSFVLGIDIGPGAEFDFPGYDAEVHGVVPGCKALEPETPARTKRGKGSGGSNDDTGSGPGDQDPPGTSADGDPAEGKPATDDATGASKENPQ